MTAPGGGGFSNSSAAVSGSGDADGISGTGDKVFNIGGNPNSKTSTNTILLVGVLVIGAWFVYKKIK